MKKFIAPMIVGAVVVGLILAINLSRSTPSTGELQVLDIITYINSQRSGMVLNHSIELDELGETILNNPSFKATDAEGFLQQRGYTPGVLKAMSADSVNGVQDLINKLNQQQGDSLKDLLSNPQYKDIGVYIGAENGGGFRRSVEVVYGARE